MPKELAKGSWQPVIDDDIARHKSSAVRRILMVSGKIYVDLVTNPARKNATYAAIVRVEQLYPFPADVISQVIHGYPEAVEVVWVQEEPENMGAWNFMRWNILELLDERIPLRCIARKRNSSPAEGSASRHALKQAMLIQEALAPPQGYESETVRDSKVAVSP
jgi:2-oxoglutarate dehydrogenase complex dehydrogenase (E1) component-like enzyme